MSFLIFSDFDVVFTHFVSQNGVDRKTTGLDSSCLDQRPTEST